MIGKFIEKIKEQKRIRDEEREYEWKKKQLPFRCRECEVLGMCRDKDNNWKFYEGKCLIKK